MTWFWLDGCRKKRNEPGESMVCWRDNAARGFDTLFCRNQGNEIFRRLFCDLVGNKPCGCCTMLLLLLLLLLLLILIFFNNIYIYCVKWIRHRYRAPLPFEVSASKLLTAVTVYVHFNDSINKTMFIYFILHLVVIKMIYTRD